MWKRLDHRVLLTTLAFQAKTRLAICFLLDVELKVSIWLLFLFFGLSQYASWKSFRSVLLLFPFRSLLYTFTSALFYRFVTALPCTVIRFLLPVLQRRIPIGAQQQSSRAVRLVVFVVSSLRAFRRAISASALRAAQSPAPQGRSCVTRVNEVGGCGCTFAWPSCQHRLLAVTSSVFDTVL